MPEKRMSLKALKDHFRRLWAAYLLGIAALVFLNNLVYTVTRPAYSDDEILRIMQLNVQADVDEAALLEGLRAADAGIMAVETQTLPAANRQDPNSVMLLNAQLIAGYGDVYLTDAAGFELLAARGACHPLEGIAAPGFEPAQCTDPETGISYTGGLCRDGLYMAAASNGTDIESALAAVGLLAAEIME